jgi:hypothetical protein
MTQFVEITLNLAWVALAALMLALWIFHAPRSGASRKTQLVALAVVILILFPVISVTDDLLATQIAAETDTCQRKALHTATAHIAPHATVIFLMAAYAQDDPGSFRLAELDNFPAPLTKAPAWAPILKRPPPSAS